MYGIQDKINQILRGAKTIKKNSMNTETTNCPNCGAKPMIHSYVCGTTFPNIAGNCSISEICKLTNEATRLRERLAKAEELIRGLHDGWKKARKAHLETCKNAQAEINKLHTENICLQELIQEFYEWTRRDYPTESEVREIMDCLLYTSPSPRD